jgi:hypothetical protein
MIGRTLSHYRILAKISRAAWVSSTALSTSS